MQKPYTEMEYQEIKDARAYLSDIIIHTWETNFEWCCGLFISLIFYWL